MKNCLILILIVASLLCVATQLHTGSILLLAAALGLATAFMIVLSKIARLTGEEED